MTTTETSSMMSSVDPWAGLEVPDGPTLTHGRRVDPSIESEFYWLLDGSGKRLLGLRHSASASPSIELPKFKGIDMVLSDLPGEPTERLLVLRLLDPSHSDVFRTLCEDIVHVAASAESDEVAVAQMLSRTWRWHHLLRGGVDGRLSEEAQKGLIGEIITLRDLVIPAVGAMNAVTAWVGPTRASRDFEIGTTSIEVKGRSEGATPYVKVSSEHQLDISDLKTMFLVVINLVHAGSEAPSKSLDDYVLDLRDLVQKKSPGASDLLEGRLSAAGYRDEDQYEDVLWIEGNRRAFGVTDDFPRIQFSELRPGLSRVTYSIELKACEPFAVDEEQLLEAIGGSGA